MNTEASFGSPEHPGAMQERMLAIRNRVEPAITRFERGLETLAGVFRKSAEQIASRHGDRDILSSLDEFLKKGEQAKISCAEDRKRLEGQTGKSAQFDETMMHAVEREWDAYTAMLESTLLSYTTRVSLIEKRAQSGGIINNVASDPTQEEAA